MFFSRFFRLLNSCNVKSRLAFIPAFATSITLVYSGRLLSFSLISGDAKQSLTEQFEKQFKTFASREFQGVLYMTPDDFVFSILNEQLPMRHLQSISEKEVCTILDKTPEKALQQPTLFRLLGNRGLISFSEYMFLLSVLNKPKSGFEIAFKVLDVNSSGTIELAEFSSLNKVASGAQIHHAEENSLSYFRLYADKEPIIQTSLMRHFFGKNGRKNLSYKEFCTFVENLQNEVLEIEFLRETSNRPTMSPAQFAHILLHHTKLPESCYENFITRLKRLSPDLEIDLSDYKKFFHFLNHLRDFQLAMKMYMLANKAISSFEFGRAIKACTGEELGDGILKTVFCLFDENADGFISPTEVMVLLKNRKLRGLSKATFLQKDKPLSFKRCVRKQIDEQS
uniref:Calcium uptake protein 2 n=3 Tax=Schistocephalus solidus TaxID=70667 RepID=A0A0X3PRV3_SCHSO